MSNLSRRISSLHQLQLLQTLADTGSISATAKALHISQPSVSMQLKKLAGQIDLALYEVQGRKVKLTEAGLAVLESSREIFSSLDRLAIRLDDLKGLRTGTLRLAVVSTAKYFTPFLLGPFCQSYPDIDVQLTVGNREQVLKRLKDNLDDFYLFSHPPKDAKFIREPFLPNPLEMYASVDHPLAKRRKPIEWHELENEAFLRREIGSGTRYAIDKFCEKNNIKLKEKMVIGSNETIKYAASTGLGLAILSRHSLVFGGNPGLVALPVVNFPITSQWYLLHAEMSQLSVLAQEFYAYMQNEGRQALEDKLGGMDV